MYILEGYTHFKSRDTLSNYIVLISIFLLPVMMGGLISHTLIGSVCSREIIPGTQDYVK